MMNQAIAHPLILNRVTLVLSESVNVVQRQGRQRQVSTALEQVSLYPAMPPQVILVVRHLADPQPETLLASNGWRRVQTWERAAQESINDCWRVAIRVARSPVMANTNSVWFADRAEWLACLSWDLARGIAGDRWWWQTVLRSYGNQSQRDILYSLWQAEIRWLPVTLMLLSRHHSINFNQIFNGLTATQTEQLLTQLMTVYQCAIPSQIFTASPLNQQIFIKKLAQRLTPSLQALIQTLPSIYKMLVTVCFNVAIAVDVQQVLQDVLTVDRLENQSNLQPLLGNFPQVPSDSSQAKIVEKESILSPKMPDLDQGAIAETNDVIETNFPDVNPPKFNQEIAELGDRNNANFKITEIQITPLESAPKITPELQEASIDSMNLIPQTTIDLTTANITNLELTTGGDHPISEPFLSLVTEENVSEIEGVQTSVGGLWYLVNLLVELNWFGRSPLITPWQQLLILSQSFLPEIPPDPVWGLLAEIVGEPLPAEVIAQWQREILPQVTDYLDGELQLPKPMADYILEPATLYFTRTHIDVVFKLEQIQFDLRVAGLDRDPDWVPELARVIAFHYE